MAEQGCMFTRGAAERIATATRQVEGSPLGRIPGGRHHKTHAGTPSLYSGPFACVAKDDTTVTVLGYNASEGRYFRNYAILGLQRIEIDEETLIDISSDCWLYLAVYWDATEYDYYLSYDADLPEQSSSFLYIPIAYIKTTDSKITSIAQVQYGIIHYPGRVF